MCKKYFLAAFDYFGDTVYCVTGHFCQSEEALQLEMVAAHTKPGNPKDITL